MATTENYFCKLNAINCNDKTEQKNGLTYLSWAYAWGEVKKLFPDANYTIYENANGWNYHTDGRTCWVKTGVTINGIEHIEYLPVMDFRNNSITLDKVTSFDVNKTIQRSLTKAVARHGLGLYIYAGEDLPEETAQMPEQKPEPVKSPKGKKTAKPVANPEPVAPLPVNTGYTPCDGETYWKLVKACADGVLCPSGKTAKARWIEMTNADTDAIVSFDQDVVAYKFGSNI